MGGGRDNDVRSRKPQIQGGGQLQGRRMRYAAANLKVWEGGKWGGTGAEVRGYGPMRLSKTCNV